MSRFRQPHREEQGKRRKWVERKGEEGRARAKGCERKGHTPAHLG